MPTGKWEHRDRDAEYRAKMAQATKGNRNALGYRHSEDEIAAISAASTAHWTDPEYRAKRRASKLRANAGYEAAHDRIRHDRGSVRELACIGCGNRAAHWALNHERAATRTLEQRGGRYKGLPYSLEPADYDPRCVRCHKRYDLDRGKH
jgi:hypothetical protein